MTSPKPNSQRDRQSTWSRARRDLGTPQGSSLISAIILCVIVSIILEIVFGRFVNLPGYIVHLIMITINIAILAIAAFKISAMNKRAAEARREVYRQKFEGDIEAIRAWSKRRKS